MQGDTRPPSAPGAPPHPCCRGSRAPLGGDGGFFQPCPAGWRRGRCWLWGWVRGLEVMWGSQGAGHGILGSKA